MIWLIPTPVPTCDLLTFVGLSIMRPPPIALVSAGPLASYITGFWMFSIEPCDLS